MGKLNLKIMLKHGSQSELNECIRIAGSLELGILYFRTLINKKSNRTDIIKLEDIANENDDVVLASTLSNLFLEYISVEKLEVIKNMMMTTGCTWEYVYSEHNAFPDKRLWRIVCKNSCKNSI